MAYDENKEDGTEHGSPPQGASELEAELYGTTTTLRDLFAMHAVSELVKVCANDDTNVKYYPDYVALKAYELADAMLRARDV